MTSSLKKKSRWQCDDCGAVQLAWSGQCSACQSWDSLKEVSTRGKVTARSNRLEIENLKDIKELKEKRLSSGLEECDRVLGGGLVQGSLVLLGGEPGIGKSTLSLQWAGHLSHSHRVMIVSGEESLNQIKHRAARLGLGKADLMLASSHELSEVEDALRQERPEVAVIDSIQVFHCEQSSGHPGSVSQVREAAHRLSLLARELDCCLLVIGHATKEGQLAGPQTLMHMVDVVLSFEGDAQNLFRVLRAHKNRYGCSEEIGLFAMGGQGLEEVKDPASLLLTSQAGQEDINKKPGRARALIMEGSRPLCVEIQALVTSGGFAYPERKVTGLSRDRLVMILAVMQSRLGLALNDQDVFVNVVGGFRVHDPAADLAVALAIVSSMRDRALPDDVVCAAEIGLCGECRPARHQSRRLHESQRLGFASLMGAASDKGVTQVLSLEAAIEELLP